MTERDGGSLFGTFNARALNANEVAATFVAPRQFSQICEKRHTIVLGPRGSGKTTLLKMLQQSALEAWSHADAKQYLKKVDFTGVFIATDISWGQQLRLLGHGQLDLQSGQLFGVASFTTHVLRSLTTAMYNRTLPPSSPDKHLRNVKLTSQQEATLVGRISNSWYLEGVFPSLLGLRQELTRRLAHIRELASKEATLGSSGRAERLAGIPFLHMQFLPSASTAIELFDDLIGQNGAKWALLFDELEIAPANIQAELMSSLRSVDDRFLFKLALNPFTENSQFLSEPTSPAPGQDFDQVALWYAEKRDALSFCRSLWNEMQTAQGLEPTDPVEILGASQFEADSRDLARDGTAYGADSLWAKKFKSLARKDASFRSYITARQINPSRLDLPNADQRAAEIRKIAPIVALRDFLIKEESEEESSPVMRSRKSASVYSGADSIFAVTEGNPRWFLGIMRAILASGTAEGGRRISPAHQGRELLRAAQRFSASLRTIPIEEAAVSVLTIARKVGTYFGDYAVKRPFRPEPPGSFIVDSNASPALLAALGQALNAGAIVYVPDDEGQLILSSLRGKRFRLAYLLAPLYEFPIRLGASVSLSTIIRSDGDDPAIEQRSLFGKGLR